MLLSGMKAPDFALKDVHENIIHLSDFLGKKIVLYFYPKDLTGGCTLQALNYKEEYQNYINKGYNIIGISKDSVKSHIKFIEKYELPFILLSDENLEAIHAYDVWHEKVLAGKKYMGVVRTTYIIDENGIVVYANDKVKAKSDATNTLEIIKNKN